MKKTEIPRTDSIRELSDFWDTHDLTEFEDELEEVKENVFEKGVELSFHLETNEFESLEEIARRKGLSDSELVREWIRERLKAA